MPQNMLWINPGCYGVPEQPPDFVQDIPEPVCDFCTAAAPVLEYDCPDFTIQATAPDGAQEDYMSRAGWYACRACAELIDHDKRRALYRRAVRLFEQRHQDIPRRYLDYMATQVDLQFRTFFDLRRRERRTGRRDLEERR